jgi:beta-glucosidase
MAIKIPTYKEAKAITRTRVANLIKSMTLAEKVGQMTQVEKNSISPEEVTEYAVGSVLSGGGGNPNPNTPQNWANMVYDFKEAARQTRLGIPLIYGVDAVHGHNNVVGATIFPHNIGLGATRDPDLVERIGRFTATEIIATGVRWNFAPCVAVPHDFRWGRTYEGYSQDTQLVAELGAAHVRGLQNANGDRESSYPLSILACPKHFVGDGGTTWGTGRSYDWIIDQWPAADHNWPIDQGITEIDEVTLRAKHLPPYIAAVEAGTKSIMVSFSSWGGLKMHANKYLLTDVLKREIGFDGFLVSDWMAIDQIDRDFYTCVVASINAGLDMVMVPFNFRRFVSTLIRAVEKGDVPLERIDDAAGRILTVKYELGLFDEPSRNEHPITNIGAEAHRQVAREAVRKSLVLLKNDDHTLPIARDVKKIVVAGQAADDIGLQCGGWTIEWMGKPGTITPGTTLLTAIKGAVSTDTTVDYDPDGRFSETDTVAEIGLVVLSESPYAEGTGDRADLSLPAADVALIERVRPCCRRFVVILFSGRPLIITEHLEKWDAFIAAWLPGTEGQGIADVLFGDFPFAGRLAYSWPKRMDQIPLKSMAESSDGPLFPFGFGLA